MDAAEIKRIARKIFLLSQAGMATAMPFTTYLVILIADISSEQLMTALAAVPAATLLFGTVGPYLAVSTAVRSALKTRLGDSVTARIARILELPRVLEMRILGIYGVGVASYSGWLVLMTNKPAVIIPWSALAFMALLALVMVWMRVYVERMLMPLALELFKANPHVSLEGSGLLWPKQRWYLPYVLALFVMSTLVTTGTIVIRVSLSKYEELTALLDANTARLLRESAVGLLQSLWIPLVALGLFMLLSAAFSAIILTRHQYNGFSAIQESIQGFVNGRPKQPEWLTTDEIGDLARITAQAFDKVSQFSLSLRTTATTLGNSAGVLNESNTAQSEVITRQAAAIQEAQVTAQEIRETSRLASEKAEGVLHQTHVIEKLGQEGEAAIAQSITSMQEIRNQVEEMASRIKTLGEHTRKIENITRTVKDLADQSNMLALNAAIEAVRSGEHGKGFGVVAREIRSLADQSVRATGRVNTILQEISESIHATVSMTEQGSERVAASVAQVKAFGESTRKLSSIMQENTLAVRQISVAVNQQNAGITQIFQAINELSTGMNETMSRLNETSSVSANVESVATRVSELIESYGWESMSRTNDKN